MIDIGNGISEKLSKVVDLRFTFILRFLLGKSETLFRFYLLRDISDLAFLLRDFMYRIRRRGSSSRTGLASPLFQYAFAARR